MQIDQTKVISLLGAGVKPGQVAMAVGCDISYISQLLSDETIALQVSELRTKDVLKYKTTDDKYDVIENILQDKLKELLPYFTKPRDVLAAIQVINGVKRRATPGLQGEIEAGEVVKLSLPVQVINDYKITINGSMIEVGGRSLAPMASSVLLKTLESKSGDANEPQKKVSELTRKHNGSNIPSEIVINEGKI